MPKYLYVTSYNADGVRGLLKQGGSARRRAAEEAAKSAGGSVESFHFGFGEKDAYVICDLPDNEAAAAVALTVSGSGTVSVSTVALLTPEEMDAAAKRTISYKPPGG